jgi:hypothetical protein
VAHGQTGMVNFTMTVANGVCSSYIITILFSVRLERVKIVINILDTSTNWAKFLICPSDRMIMKCMASTGNLQINVEPEPRGV